MAFRICTIGCGGMASSGHGPAHARYAAEHPDVRLAGCCDVRPEAAEAFRERFGYAKAYADWEAMLDIERPDAVCAYLPVTLTAPLVCAILERGLPTLTEKPPGMTIDEVDALIAAAGDTPNQVAFNRRYAPLVRELQRRLPTDIQHLRYDFARYRRADADFSTTAIHGIDTVRHLAGDYRRIRFHYRPYPEFGPAVANLLLDAELASGATALLEFCPMAGVLIERATVHALDETFFLHIPIGQGFDVPGRLQHVKDRQLVADLSGLEISDGEAMFEESGFYGENAAFFDALREGRRPAPDLRACRQSVAVMQALRERREVYEA